MDRRFFKRLIPHPDQVRRIRALHFLGEILHEPNLWHINRHSVSRALLLGIFWCMVPMPFQSIPAAMTAIWLNANLPLTLVTVWISNPLTMGPMLYAGYAMGVLVLGRPEEADRFQFSWEWFSARVIEVGIPLYMGSLILGLIFSLSAYLVIQQLWRRRVRQRWRQRKREREVRNGPH
ncbi:DUF2062 domain-containing protein [Halomonadaceae bacterium KBTZ08]